MLRNVNVRSFRVFPVSTTETVTRKANPVQEHRSGKTEMSSAEMYSYAFEAAQSAPTDNWKDRVHAAARVLNLPFARAKAFYYREPRRVTAEEMDYARQAIRALRDERRQRKAAELVANLNRTVAYLRATDPDGYSADIAALEHTLSRAGLLDRALAETEGE